MKLKFHQGRFVFPAPRKEQFRTSDFKLFDHFKISIVVMWISACSSQPDMVTSGNGNNVRLPKDLPHAGCRPACWGPNLSGSIADKQKHTPLLPESMRATAAGIQLRPVISTLHVQPWRGSGGFLLMLGGLH